MADGSDKYLDGASDAFRRMHARMFPPKPRTPAGLRDAMEEDKARGKPGRAGGTSGWPVGK